MTRSRPNRTNLYYLMSLATVIFVALNLIANQLFEGWQIDLTENKLYTLSDGTKQVLSAIDEPLTLRLFYTEETATGYPVIQNYASRIKGMLKQYAVLSNGKLKLEILNPEPFSETEDLAVAHGLRGIPVDTAGNKIFFGLSVANAVDETQSIAFLSPERQAFLEYDLTRLIDRLGHRKEVKLGILSWLPMRGSAKGLLAGQGPWAIYEQMEEFFEVEVLKVDVERIPDDIDVLLVAHPAPISDQTLYAVDQFMMRGGKAVFLIDPHVEIDDQPEKASNLEPLLTAWGVHMKDKYVAGDMEAAIRVSTSDDVSALSAAPNVTWLMLGEKNFNREEILSAELNTMVMPTVGVVEPVKEAGTSFTPLIHTGEQSFLIENMKLMFAKQDPTILLDNMLPSEQPLTLAARVEGTLKSAFAGRTEKDHLDASQAPASFIVVGDSDFLRDGFWVQKQEVLGTSVYAPSADNGAFLLNVIDYLSGNQALLSLRTRTTEDRRFEVVDALRREAEGRFREEEEALRQKLRDMEKQLGDLQGEEGGALLSESQQEKLEQYRAVMVDTRRQLRQVQHELRSDIEALGARLKLIHIGLIPLVVLLAGLWLPRRLGMRRG